MVSTILNNPFYCGLIRIKKTGETFAGIHQSLIPASLFKRVQDRSRNQYEGRLSVLLPLYFPQFSPKA